MRADRIFEQRISAGMQIADRLARRFDSWNYDSRSEAYLALVIAARKFTARTGDNFEAFAQVSIRNRLVSLTRQKYPLTVDWQGAEAGGTPEQPELGALARFLAVENRAQLRAERREFLALLRKGLTRDEKRLLLLLLRGESQTAIAQATGTSQPTVSRRVRALGLKAREIVGAYSNGQSGSGSRE